MSSLFQQQSFEEAFKSFLSQRIGLLPGDKGKLLVDTSCMSEKYRKMYGYLEGFDEFLKLVPNIDKDKLKEWTRISKGWKAIIIKLGQSEWKRNELTDLGLKIGLEEGKRFSLT